MTDEQGQLFPDAAPKQKKPRVEKWQLKALIEAYPRQEAIAAGENAARVLLKTGQIQFPALLERVEAFAAYTDESNTQYTFIPLPATWFRQRWKDDMAEVRRRSKPKPTIQPGQPSRKELEERRREQAAWDARHTRQGEPEQ
jgi:hypothetical protein